MSPRQLNLTDAEIVEIRHRYHDEPQSSQTALAAEYGTTRTTVSRICRHMVRPELGGPLTKNRHWTVAQTLPFSGPADVAYTIAATAGYLGLVQSSVRDYIMRGRLVRDSPGLVSFDSIVAYEETYKRFQPTRFGPPPPPPLPTRCTRCGLLEFDDDGLCCFCHAELQGAGFVLYYKLDGEYRAFP